jgi:hypothetical protein
MGMSSHFFLAGRAASSAPSDVSQSPREDGANYLGITPLELSTLWAIIEGSEWDVKMMRLFPIVTAVSVGDQIVHEIPSPIAERLAAMSQDDIARIAQMWTTTVEMSLRGDETGQIVGELARLSARALATRRGFFLANRFIRH